MSQFIEVINFTNLKTLKGRHIHEVWDYLYLCVGSRGTRKIILDLAGVEEISCEVLGKIFLLNRMLKNLGGQLIICNVDINIARIFNDIRALQTWPCA